MKLSYLGFIIAVGCCVCLATPEDGKNASVTTKTSPKEDVGLSSEPSPAAKSPERLQDVEDRLKKNVQSITKLLLPYIMESALDVPLSGKCSSSMLGLFRGIQSLADWAIRMMDASGKPPSGILKGTTTALGDYDECLEISEEPTRGRRTSGIQGQYCMLEIRPSHAVMEAILDYQYGNRSASQLAITNSFFKYLRQVRGNPKFIAFRLGICLPSLCSLEDVKKLADVGSKSLHAHINVRHCEIKQELQLNMEHKIILGVFSAVLLAMTIGTTADLFLRYRTPEEDSINTSRNIAKSRLTGLFRSFSVLSNVEKFLAPSENDDPTLGAIQGLRIFSVISTIYMNTYGLVNPEHTYRYRDSLNLVQFSQDITFSSVANPSAGVDSYFFLAGFLYLYPRWKSTKKPSIGAYLPRYICLQYLRMATIQLLIIAIFLIFPLIGSGPLWQDFIGSPLEACTSRWWTNILFIQNFWEVYDMCLYHTWFLATMMQLYLVTAILLFLLSRWSAAGIVLTVLTIIGGAVATGVITAIKGYSATLSSYLYDYRTASSLWINLYVQVYNHIGPFCIGLLLALLLATYPKLKLRLPFVILGWCLSTAILLSIVYGLYPYRDGHPMNWGLATFYAAAHRHGWALSVAWLVFACARGYGGWINSLMSWKALVPLDRLSYLAYLLHVLVMYYRGATLRELMFMGKFEQVMVFLGYLCITFAAAFVLYILFQVPYMYIESLIWPSPDPNPIEQDKTIITLGKDLSFSELTCDKANGESDWSKVRGVVNKRFYI